MWTDGVGANVSSRYPNNKHGNAYNYRWLLLWRDLFQRVVRRSCPGELSLCQLPSSCGSSGGSLDCNKTFAVPIHQRNATQISDGTRRLEGLLPSLWNVSHL